MQRLAGILFEMGAGQMDELFLLADMNGQPAARHHGNLELADLVTLGQVGVEVILAREDRTRRNLRADGQAELDRADDCFTIQYRQHPGQGDIHGAGLAVRLRAKGHRCAGKDFRFCLQLGMGFQPDNHFPSHFIASGIRVCQSVAC